MELPGTPSSTTSTVQSPAAPLGAGGSGAAPAAGLFAVLMAEAGQPAALPTCAGAAAAPVPGLVAENGVPAAASDPAQNPTGSDSSGAAASTAPIALFMPAPVMAENGRPGATGAQAAAAKGTAKQTRDVRPDRATAQATAWPGPLAAQALLVSAAAAVTAVGPQVPAGGAAAPVTAPTDTASAAAPVTAPTDTAIGPDGSSRTNAQNSDAAAGSTVAAVNAQAQSSTIGAAPGLAATSPAAAPPMAAAPVPDGTPAAFDTTLQIATDPDLAVLSLRIGARDGASQPADAGSPGTAAGLPAVTDVSASAATAKQPAVTQAVTAGAPPTQPQSTLAAHPSTVIPMPQPIEPARIALSMPLPRGAAPLGVNAAAAQHSSAAAASAVSHSIEPAATRPASAQQTTSTASKPPASPSSTQVATGDGAQSQAASASGSAVQAAEASQSNSRADESPGIVSASTSEIARTDDRSVAMGRPTTPSPGSPVAAASTSNRPALGEEQGSPTDDSGRRRSPSDAVRPDPAPAAAPSTGPQATAAVGGARTATDTTGQSLDARIRVVQQVADKLDTMRLASGRQEVTLQLRPEHLGELRLTIIADRDGVTARVVAQTSAAHHAVDSGRDELRSALEQRGFKLQSLDVALGQRGDDRGFQSSSQFGRQPSQPSPRGGGASGTAEPLVTVETAPVRAAATLSRTGRLDYRV